MATRNPFEAKCEKLLPNTTYEPYKIKYEVHKKCTYLPDFVDEERKIIWEAKGHFRLRPDASKYIPIVAQCKANGYRFIFIFQKPNTAMPGVRVRRNGTKQSMADWANTNDFEWCTVRSIPKELRTCL